MDTRRRGEAFPCLTDDPLRLAVINVGLFTDACYKLQPGDTIYVRGPYGRPVLPPGARKSSAWPVAPELAAVYQIARDFGSEHSPSIFLPGPGAVIGFISLMNAMQ